MNERRNTAKKKKTVKLMNLDRLERTDMDKQNVAGKDETYKKLYLDNCHNKARKPEYVINGCNLYKVAVKGKGDSLEVEEAAFIGKAVKVKNIKEGPLRYVYVSLNIIHMETSGMYAKWKWTRSQI